MKTALLSVLASLPLAAQVTITFSPQNAPFPLPKGITLYSVEATSKTPRAISAAQIRQAAEASGIDYQEPVNVAIPPAKSTKNLTRMLNITKYVGGGFTVASGAISAEKSSGSAPGNANTWAELAAATAALAAGSMLAETQLQSAVSGAATTTTGVFAALMDPTAIYSLSAGGGLPKAVMIFGIAPSAASKPLTTTVP